MAANMWSPSKMLNIMAARLYSIVTECATAYVSINNPYKPHFQFKRILQCTVKKMKSTEVQTLGAL